MIRLTTSVTLDLCLFLCDQEKLRLKETLFKNHNESYINCINHYNTIINTFNFTLINFNNYNNNNI